MKRIELYKPSETIEVEVGDKVQAVTVDLSNESMKALSQAAGEASRKLAPLTVAEAKARAEGDGRALKSIEGKVGKVLEDFAKKAIGADQLKAVLDMCGGKMTPGTRTLVIMPLISYIMETVDKNMGLLKQAQGTIDTLAVHYRGGDDAQPPDQAE